MRTKPMTPMEDATIERPGQSGADRFPTDQLLRRHGFEIHERKTGQQAVWLLRQRGRKPVLFTQTEALQFIATNEQNDSAKVGADLRPAQETP